MSRYRNNTPYFTLGLIWLTGTIIIVTWLNKFHRKSTIKQNINSKINCVKIYKGPPFIAVFVIIIYSNAQGIFTLFHHPHTVNTEPVYHGWNVQWCSQSVFDSVIHSTLNTKCSAAVKLWPKCFGLRRCLTATYRKEQPIIKVKIIVEWTIYLTQTTIHSQKLVKGLPNVQLQ